MTWRCSRQSSTNFEGASLRAIAARAYANLAANSRPPRNVVEIAQVTPTIDVTWSFDPEIMRHFARVREMVTLQHQTPTREWPMIVEESREELLVVREWPNGTITAYTMPVPEGSK